MFKFLHCADFHLDSPLLGLERYEGAPVEAIRNATRRASDNLVALAIEEEVAFVVIAGDLYDQDWKDYNTGLFFVSQMAKLRRRGIPVFIVLGNHDAASKMTKSLRLPDNVTVFDHHAPQSHVLESLGVVIHGQSFSTGSVTEDLSSDYPAARTGLFNVGVLHTCATGRPGHAPYAPCTLDGLLTSGYDYWALGHVHTREVLHDDPPIVFPGNIQGRHIRETGAKGCMLVTVGRDQKAHPEFRPLDVMRWAKLEIDGSDCLTPGEIADQVTGQLGGLVPTAQGRPLAVRVRISGASPAHQTLRAEESRWVNEIRSRVSDLCGDEGWIEKVEIGTRQIETGRTEGGGDGPLSELLGIVHELRTDEDRLSVLTRELEELSRKIPADLKRRDGTPGLDDPAWVREALDDVQSLLMKRLQPGERSR